MEKETVFILLFLLKPMTKTSQLNEIATMIYWQGPCAKNINSLFFAIILMKITRRHENEKNGKFKEDVFRRVLIPKWPFKMAA